MASGFDKARQTMIRLFRERGTAAYRRRDLDRIFAENRTAWGLAKRTRAHGMVALLLDSGELATVTLSPTDSSYPNFRGRVDVPV